MKRSLRFFAVIIMAVALFTSMATYAYAGFANRDINDYVGGFSFSTISGVGVKSDTSPLYVRMNTNYAVSGYRIRAMGCTVNKTDLTNWTYANGKLVDYVTCNMNTEYSIQSLIKENGDDCATLAICGLGGSSTATGVWSPDSVGTYTYAVP